MLNFDYSRKKYLSDQKLRFAFLAGQTRALGLLVKAGIKPLACLDVGLTSKDLTPSGTKELNRLCREVSCRAWIREHRPKRFSVYLVPSTKQGTQTLKTLKATLKHYRSGLMSKKDYHTKMGRLFGFPESAIEAFLNKSRYGE